MNISFKYCSLQYLSIWETHDKNCNNILSNSKDLKEKSGVLKKAGSFYSVARTFPKENNQLLRYQPILKIFDNLNEEKIKKEPISMVLKIKDEISNYYQNKNILSGTTKFLWLKMKHPIIIYDSQAKKALEIENNEYEAFYTKWRDEYKKHENEIIDVCNKLENLYEYLPTQRENLQKDISAISSETWFHERVFDIYLWNKGK